MANLKKLLKGIAAQLKPGDNETFSTVMNEPPRPPQAPSSLSVQRPTAQPSLRVGNATPPPIARTQSAVVPQISLAPPAPPQPNVRVLDNGPRRTTPDYENMPVNPRLPAIREHVLNFAHGVIDPVVRTGLIPVEAGRSLVADVTGDDAAMQAAEQRKAFDVENSAPVAVGRGLWEFGDAARHAPAAFRNVVTGGPVSTNPVLNFLLNPAQAVYQAAGGDPMVADQHQLDEGLSSLNRSYLGPLLSGPEKVITSTIPTAADQAAGAGFDPNQSIASTAFQTGLGGLQALAPVGGVEYSAAARGLGTSALAEARAGIQFAREANAAGGEGGYIKLPSRGAKPKPEAPAEPPAASPLKEQIMARYKGKGGTEGEKKTLDYVLKNPEKAMADYDKRVMAEFGVSKPNIVAGDDAKFVVSGEDPLRQKLDGTKSGEYHEPASALAKVKLDQLLADPATKDRPVLLMAGGSGAGKTSGLKQVLKSGGRSLDDYAAVIDTNSNALSSADSKIQQALKSGRKVEMAYVYRDPLVAFKEGVIPRSKKIGRIVPVAAHLDTHLGSNEVIHQLAEKYKGNPDVAIGAVDNSGAAGSAKFVPVDQIPKLSYNRGELKAQLERMVQDEQTITDAERQTYLGTQTPAPKADLGSPSGQPQRAEPKQVAPATSKLAAVKERASVKTTDVKLNTGRLDTTDVGKANLDKATSEVITRMSNKDVQTIAKDAGLDTKTHSDEQLRVKIAEQLNIRRDAVKLQNEAEAARVAGDPERAATLLAKSAEQGRISRMQGTEAGRALQARNIIANELDTPQQRIFKLLDNAGVNPEVYAKRLADVDFKNADEVVKAYRELVPPKWHEWLDTVRYNSMLSSPLTHITNLGSNAANVLGVAPIEKTLRGAFDAAGGLFGRERQFAAGEGAAYFKGAVSNIREGANRFVEVMAGRKGATNLDIKESLAPLAVDGAKGKVYKTLSFPMRLLEASDQFFTTLAREGEAAALNLREGKGIAIKGDKTALAEAEAAYRLFRQDTGMKGQGAVLDAIDQVTNGLMRFRNSKNTLLATAAKFSLPFVKTPMNVLKQGVEFSPLGYSTMIGASSKLTQFTRATIGTAVFGMAGAMVAAGDMTWAEPTNPEEKARFRSEGKQPYSIRIGDHWVAFSKMPPAVSFPFALTAGIHDSIENKKMDQGTADAILAGVAKWGQFLGDQSYVKNIGDTLATFKGDPEKIAQLYSNYPQQLIPFRAMTGWLARMTDPNDRKLNTDKGYVDQQVQALMLQYPGLREKVPTRDYQGAPIPANNQVFNAVSPVRITNDRGVSPIDQELDAAKEAKAVDPLLTKEQQNAVTKRAKASLPAKQRELIASDAYKAMSAKDRATALTRLKSDVTAVERKKYMAENSVGEYANDYTGKGSTLTPHQLALDDGKNTGDIYSSPSNSVKAKGLSGGSNATLDKVAALDTSQRRTYLDNPKNEYEYNLARFENDSKNGKLSDVDRYQRLQTLGKQKVTSSYSREVLDLYSLSKSQLAGYMKEHPVSQEVVNNLLKLDEDLSNNGFATSRKYKHGMAVGSGKKKTTAAGSGSGKNRGYAIAKARRLGKFRNFAVTYRGGAKPPRIKKPSRVAYKQMKVAKA